MGQVQAQNKNINQNKLRNSINKITNNLVVPSDPNMTWTGTTNVAWNNPNNWSPYGVPLKTTNVTIPAGLNNYPKLTGDSTIKSINMRPGSKIDFYGKSLTIVSAAQDNKIIASELNNSMPNSDIVLNINTGDGAKTTVFNGNTVTDNLILNLSGTNSFLEGTQINEGNITINEKTNQYQGDVVINVNGALTVKHGDFLATNFGKSLRLNRTTAGTNYLFTKGNSVVNGNFNYSDLIGSMLIIGGNNNVNTVTGTSNINLAKAKVTPTLLTETSGTTPTITSTTNKNITTNHSAACSSNNEGDTYTSITTSADGTIYSVWVDENSALKIIQIKTDGTKTEKILRTNVQADNYHVRPSVAIDKTGKIHVAGDMHNDAWVYYISIYANDVSAGFNAQNPPCHGVTYPQFFKDINDELYITFRHKIKETANYWTAGSNGASILRYYTDDGSFTLLGGTNYSFQKTLIWSNTGAGGTAKNYQKPSIRLFFDKNNRMHLICNLVNEETTGTSEVNTHLLYAYSDNGGNSWFQITGYPIASLPMTVENLTSVTYRSQKDIRAGCFLGIDTGDKPIFGWVYGGTNQNVFRYNGTNLQNIKPETSAPADVYTRRNGEICIIRPFQGVYISTNNGLSYSKFIFNPALSSPSNISFDREFYINTGNIRFQYMDITKAQLHVVSMMR